MGCCFGKDDDKANNENQNNETSRLISDSSCENGGVRIDGYDTFFPGDEQSAYNRIVTQVSKDVIDVSSLHAPSVEYSDIADREKHYKQKLNLALGGSFKKKHSLIPGCKDPYALLSARVINFTDLNMIQQAALNTNGAVSDIHISHKESLVVPFTVP
ncbi:DgyrCDS3788 [Dimorphilus gyrociliatus]|uniref:Ragulator complex protein LAMTOR1 n=1 Tax=Dimorphilus gyrociliatus TaxID=2664684 RepID=A0A7I8VHK8_9ANNE|nr:DgyrCDS3788 [Dimorphilus gyrociliatus]